MASLRMFLLYTALVTMTVVLVGVGFHTAEKGIQSMVGSGGPPKSIHVDADNQAIQVTVLGKQVVQPKPTLGDKWSRQLESTKSEMGETMTQLSFGIGRLLQDLSRGIIEWVGDKLK
ncbi:hypothetical protein [Effusibacillus lacus]|uniref:DUF3679 domain-containing protein n=1 Tax=Effusibacillus lacus TaxID=1348429 RepID=A0A292YNB9_9BACL|nr:hypothetical protein [Effusibacillus lacus]TCS68768.1 hypothetical protein EDD64_14018 [Effusibacillus lacus]GAX90686.1 hypothetical protein EFBL_2324 [Effusibacillus lacus]